jgi:hypothetical protein
MTDVLQNPARWTDDCQGKQDFDGLAVLISTRYWPGPITVFNTAGPWKGFYEIPGGPPSARAALCINHGEPLEHGYADEFVLAERRFEGATGDDVKRQVEEWVQQQFERMTAALRREFDV